MKKYLLFLLLLGVGEKISAQQTETITLDLSVDYYGSEFYYEVMLDADTSTSADGLVTILYVPEGTYPDLVQGQLFTSSFELESGNCYQINVYDGYGDGLAFTTGSFVFSCPDSVLFGAEGNYGDIVEHYFCIPTGVPEEVTVCIADCDGDGWVSVTDLTCFIASYGAIEQDPDSTYWPDFDSDGIIGVSDLVYFISLYGQSCP